MKAIAHEKAQEDARTAPFPLILIDTCGLEGTIAVVEAAPSPVVTHTAALPGRSASERLLPAIRAALANRGLGPGSLRAVAVVHGPGSFTGVRVGLSAAKGLSEALGIPLVAISRLAVVAGKASGGRVVALLDAGRGEFYAGEYFDGQGERESLRTKDQVLALAGTPGVTLIACEPTVAADLAPVAVRLVPELIAADALPIALERLGAGDFDDPTHLDANYVRRTDAEIFAKPAVRR